MPNATSDSPLSKVWTLKYAPQSISEVILSKENSDIFCNLSEITNNLLFLGNTGCGKTTLAKLLAKKFAPNSYIFINASEESGIDVVRNKISDFVSIMSFDGNIKIVVLDECLEENTLVSILRDGEKQKIAIKDVDETTDLVKSFNFKTNTIEYRPFYKIYKGQQDIYELDFENNEKIKCTLDHKWYVEFENKVIKMKLSDMIKNNIQEIITVG